MAQRVIADGAYVALHGRFVGLDVDPLIGFDINRVENGKIVEHRDGLVPEAAVNASGRSQLDGPETAHAGGDHELNREIVVKFFTETLIQADYGGFRRFTNGVHFLQHSPDIGDGVETVIDFLVDLKASGKGLEYERIHRTVAEGPYVLTHAEGRIAGQRHAFFEL